MEEALERVAEVSRELYARVQNLHERRSVEPLNHKEIREARTELMDKYSAYRKDTEGVHDFYSGPRVMEVVSAIHTMEQYLIEAIRTGKNPNMPEIKLAELIAQDFNSNPRDYVCMDKHEPDKKFRTA
jgi:hypothetical protein